MGVEFLFGGRRARAQCVKEIHHNVPQILELSGIGDPEVLRKAGVEVKLELPGVGANVQEHLYSGVSYEVVRSVVDGHEVHTFDALMNPDEAQKHFALHSSGKGSLNLNTIGLTFVPLDTICADSRTVQRTLTETIRAGIAAGTFPAGLRKQYELQLEHLAQKVPSLEIVLGPGLIAPSGVPDPNKKHVSLCFGLNAPFSRGTIHIASNDPLAQPVIDPHVFEQPYDLRSMVELVKFNRRLAKTEPLKSIFAEKEVYPGPQVETDEQIAEWLKGAVGTTFHTVGTCSMLPLEDGGVVDHRLKVHKTTNIRVVDASIIPLHIGSHTQAMVYALGEQAADIIKGVI
ncbi:Oxygen-dependent choline dehydrogenase [Grifola frondosa]|uniref:Oxygen-dependent choline dehydrogenase n=1 Tax=Grifola frondosa TaxID=5627 RepID=A0A1C7MAA4_GRIFR|nr:Oxygen-dependent choline dehydrogenase [Grifola frondosa]